MNILVVEDNVTMASSLRSLLGHLGLRQIVTTADGGEALHLLKSERFDMLIVDWTLSSLSGAALVEWMRGHEDYHDTPIVLVTAQDGAEDAQNVAKAGIQAYALALVDTDVLRETIGKIVASRHHTAAS